MKLGNRCVVKTFFLILWTLNCLCAQEGTLDSTFGINGRVSFSICDQDNKGFQIASLPDGKLIVAGNSCGDYMAMRLLGNGMIDSSFGSNGSFVIDIHGNNDLCVAMAIQQDGKILLGGYTSLDCSSAFAMTRVHPNGTLDTNFGNSGIVITDLSDYDDRGSALKVQDDGKILFVGKSFADSNYYNIAVIRYQEDGSLDSSFGNSGIVMTDHLGRNDLGYDVVVQSDGKILICGQSDGAGIISRYLEDGSIDATFEGGGITTFQWNGQLSSCRAMDIQSDGRFIVSGNYRDSVFVVRFTQNGFMDSTCMGKSEAILNFNKITDKLSWPLKTYKNNRILASGGIDLFNGSSNFTLIQLNENGSPYMNFGTNGTILDIPFPVTDFALTPDDKIVTVGYKRYIFGEYKLELARYNGGTVSIHEPKSPPAFFIYPNPAHSNFNISGIPASEIHCIQLYSMQGQLLKKYDNVNSSYSIEGIHSGFYFIEVILNDGQRRALKLLKE